MADVPQAGAQSTPINPPAQYGRNPLASSIASDVAPVVVNDTFDLAGKRPILVGVIVVAMLAFGAFYISTKSKGTVTQPTVNNTMPTK